VPEPLWRLLKIDIVLGLLAFSLRFLPPLVAFASFLTNRVRRVTWKTWRCLAHSRLEIPHDGTSEFHYHPLDDSDNEIRLLRLHPGEDNESIAVDIIHVSLNDNPRYLALSYVWGSTEVLHQISVNGKPKTVGLNLYLALKYLRNMKGQIGEHANALWWIDALSIDQSNYVERGHQVRVMKDIYTRAEKVMVWLGPPTEESELALATIRAMVAESLLYTAAKRKKEEEDERAKIGEKKPNVSELGENEKERQEDEEQQEMIHDDDGRDKPETKIGSTKAPGGTADSNCFSKSNYSGPFSLEYVEELRSQWDIGKSTRISGCVQRHKVQPHSVNRVLLCAKV
jgi:hypothetical protein